MMGIQAWMANEIVALKIAVATLTQRLTVNSPSYSPAQNSSEQAVSNSKFLVNKSQ
jgi:hypothetical protein